MVYGCTSHCLYPPWLSNPDHKCCTPTTNYMYILSNYTTNYYTTGPTITLQHGTVQIWHVSMWIIPMLSLFFVAWAPFVSNNSKSTSSHIAVESQSCCSVHYFILLGCSMKSIHIEVPCNSHNTQSLNSCDASIYFHDACEVGTNRYISIV